MILDANLSPHVTESSEVEELYRAYSDILEPNGHLILLGTIIVDRGLAHPAHISRRSVDDYTRLLRRAGIEILWTEVTAWKDILIVGRNSGTRRSGRKA